MLERLESFFLRPATSRPLAALRIGLATLLLLQGLLIIDVVPELFGRSGILQGALHDYFMGFDVLETVGVRALLRAAGIPEITWLRGLFAAYLCALLALTAGWRCRLAAAAACLTHALLALEGRLSMYGVDQFAQVALFYLALEPGATGSPATPRARLVLRMLQIHLCIAYLSSGLAKMEGAEWWNGEAIFRSVMMPMYATFPMGWIASVPLAAKLLAWGTLIVEVGYPVFIWPARTRPIWIAAIVGLHLGILVFLRLVTFALVMIVLTVAAFGVSPEPNDRD